MIHGYLDSLEPGVWDEEDEDDMAGSMPAPVLQLSDRRPCIVVTSGIAKVFASHAFRITDRKSVNWQDPDDMLLRNGWQASGVELCSVDGPDGGARLVCIPPSFPDALALPLADGLARVSTRIVCLDGILRALVKNYGGEPPDAPALLALGTGEAVQSDIATPLPASTLLSGVIAAILSTAAVHSINAQTFISVEQTVSPALTSVLAFEGIAPLLGVPVATLDAATVRKELDSKMSNVYA
jgi:hypothetical protein